MANPRLFVRSAKAREIARRLACRENRSLTDIVERALETYEIRAADREPAASFYARLLRDDGTDIDLEPVTRG
jgi:hypothetical protein